MEKGISHDDTRAVSMMLRVKLHTKQFFSVVLLFCAIFGGMGGLVFGLYRIAVFSRSIYAVVFYIALAGLVGFYVFRGIRKKLILKVLVKFAFALGKLFFILFCIACVMLYGAFVVRFPVIGAVVTPVVAALIIFYFSRLKIGSFLHKCFHYFQQRY
jgi:hypothetical protein